MSSARTTSPKVAAIVLNYNGREITLQAVQSLLAMTYPSFDVLVVDNGSTDGSDAALRERFPTVARTRVEKNDGSTAGCNHGLRHALRGNYDYLLLLNNDIEVHPEMLTELVRVAESDPRIAAVGPKAYYHGQRDHIWSAGGIICFRETVTRERGNHERERGQYDADADVDYINGCAILMRRSVLEEIGLWDATYKFAIDDADWCERARRAGYRSVYVHKAELWHMVAFTMGGYHAERVYWTGRGMGIFVRRYASFWRRLQFFALLSIAMPVAFVRELARGNQAAVLAKLRGIREGLRLEPAAPRETYRSARPGEGA